jgi:hypothetical protein
MGDVARVDEYCCGSGALPVSRVLRLTQGGVGRPLSCSPTFQSGEGWNLVPQAKDSRTATGAEGHN